MPSISASARKEHTDLVVFNITVGPKLISRSVFEQLHAVGRSAVATSVGGHPAHAARLE